MYNFAFVLFYTSYVIKSTLIIMCKFFKNAIYDPGLGGTVDTKVL